jgi:hypothetical protein
MRRVVGVLVAVAALVGAAASQPGVLEGARLEAREAAEKAATPVALRASEALRAYLRGLESRAQTAAALPQLRAQLALLRNHRLEGELQATLADWFRGEPEWEPLRLEFPVYAISADEGSLGLQEGTTELKADRLVEDARQGGVASAWIAAGGQPYAAAAARVVVPNRRAPAVVLLAKPLGDQALKEIGDRAGGGLLLAEGKREIARAASASELVRLSQAAQSGEAATYVPEDGTWAATAVPVTGAFRLWVGLDASATAQQAGAAVRTTQIVIWAAGALICLLALFFGLRRGSGTFVPAAPGATRDGRPSPLHTPAGEDHPADRESDGNSGLDELPVGATPEEPYRPQPFGRYLLVDRLGEGGMAQVYTAVIFGAEGFRRRFVIKRLRPELLKDPTVVAQFIDEANMASSLVHSNIVPVLDFGKVGNEYFLATEYILGRDLDRVTARYRETARTGLPLPAVLYAGHETLKALEYAHTKSGAGGRPLGIVHRDVSPNNVLVSSRGEIKLFDFGIVKAEGRVTRTQHGVVKGNVIFMSPEQARAQEVDARSDLFSLGLVLYYCLSGEALYRGNTSYELLLKAATGPTADDLGRLRALPEPAGTIIERALQVDVAARYQSAAEFLAAIAPHVGRGAIAMTEIMNRHFAEELRREEARFTAAPASASQVMAAAEPSSNVRPSS